MEKGKLGILVPSLSDGGGLKWELQIYLFFIRN